MENLFYNGRFITLDEEGDTCEWVVVRDGKVLGCGSSEPPSGMKFESRIDLRKQVVTPGLEDCHVHFAAVGMMDTILDLSGASSKKEALIKIEDRVEKSGEEVIYGRGWNNNLWGDRDFSKGDLPQISKPIVLNRIDGHAVLVNDVALRLSGIDENTHDPSGGRIMRDGQGRLTGVLVDRAMEPVVEKFGFKNEKTLREAFARAQTMFFNNGIVKIHDMGGSLMQHRVLSELDREKKLDIRVYGFFEGEKDFDFASGFPSYRSKNYEIAGIKLYADGSLGSRSAFVLQPYKNTGNRGFLTIDSGVYQKFVQYALKHDLQLAVHAIGDGAMRFLINELQKMKDRILQSRFRIEHAFMIDDGDMGKLSGSGLIASTQPCHYLSDRSWLGDVLGGEQLRKVYSFERMKKCFAAVAVGTDAPVEPIDPIRNFLGVRERREEGFSVEDVLRGYTLHAAFASFKEQSRGRIKQGFDADFTLFSKDPCSSNLKDLSVTGVVVDGKMIISL